VPPQGRCLRRSTPAPRPRSRPTIGADRSPRRWAENDPSRVACNSPQNAGSPAAAPRLVRVTHPFHPLSGKQLVCVGERYNRYGTRLLLRADEDVVCSVPRQWTDVVTPDPEMVIGGGRALLRVSDLLELAELVERLVGRKHGAGERKDNSAAIVRETAPLPRDAARENAADCGAMVCVTLGRRLDSDSHSGVIVVTNESPCRSEAPAKTRRRRPSSRGAR
jgi:hypothetical protein